MGLIFKRLDVENRRGNERATIALQNQGIEIVSPSLAERQRWRSIAKEAELRYQGKGLYSEEMYEILQGHLRDFRQGAADDVEP